MVSDVAPAATARYTAEPSVRYIFMHVPFVRALAPISIVVVAVVLAFATWNTATGVLVPIEYAGDKLWDENPPGNTEVCPENIRIATRVAKINVATTKMRPVSIG